MPRTKLPQTNSNDTCNSLLLPHRLKCENCIKHACLHADCGLFDHDTKNFEDEYMKKYLCIHQFLCKERNFKKPRLYANEVRQLGPLDMKSIVNALLSTAKKIKKSLSVKTKYVANMFTPSKEKKQDPPSPLCQQDNNSVLSPMFCNVQRNNSFQSNLYHECEANTSLEEVDDHNVSRQIIFEGNVYETSKKGMKYEEFEREAEDRSSYLENHSKYKTLSKFNIPFDNNEGVSVRAEIMSILITFLLENGNMSAIKAFSTELVNLLETNEDDQPIKIVFSDLASSLQQNDIPLTFKHNNNRHGILVSIPRCQIKKTFDSTTRKKDWVTDIFRKVVSRPTNADSDNGATVHNVAEWFCSYCAKEYEESFRKVALQHGLMAVKKMSKEAAAAMWSDANVSTTVARIILRHLRAAFGWSIQVPEKELNSFSKDIIKCTNPKFGSLLYYKDEKKVFETGDPNHSIDRRKKPEKICYVLHDCPLLIAEDIRRLLMTKIKRNKRELEARTNNEITIKSLLDEIGDQLAYGYSSGVSAVCGCDHGGGSSRIIIKVNLEAPSERKKADKVEFGSRVIPFGNIRCKKDEVQILAAVFPEVNRMIKTIKNGKLVAVISLDNGDLDVLFLPKSAFGISLDRSNGKIFLTWFEGANESKRKQLKLDPTHDDFHWWETIQSFDLFICGDLAFYATIQGRDGASGVRCPYCEISLAHNRNNKDESLNEEQLLNHPRLTLQRAIELGRQAEVNPAAGRNVDLKGFKYSPLIDVEPCRFISPLLHEQIGLTNYGWKSLKDFLDRNVELISDEEIVINQSIVEISEEIEKLKEDELFYNSEREALWEDLLKLRRERTQIDRSLRHFSQLRVEDQRENSAQINFNQSKRNELEPKIESASYFHKQSKNEVDNVKKMLKTKRATLKSLKESKTQVQKERLKEENSLESLIEEVLIKYEIKPQAFHGGAMNGVCTKRLLTNVQEIMTEVQDITLERLQKERTVNDRRCNRDRLCSTLMKYTNLFLVLDVVFKSLRIIAPNEDEIKQTEQAIEVLREMWKDLRLSVTPKAHILFCHTIEQYKKFDGIADKVEDFVEKSHQQGKKLEHIVSRMPKQCYNQQQMTIFKRIWTDLDPDVEEKKQAVKDQMRRKRKAPPNETTNDKKKRRRNERRNETMASAFYQQILRRRNNN